MQRRKNRYHNKQERFSFIQFEVPLTHFLHHFAFFYPMKYEDKIYEDGNVPWIKRQTWQCWVMRRNTQKKWGTSATNSQRSGALALNVSSCWWLICSWWCAGIGAVAIGKSATVLSLWVPGMAINWLPAALGRRTTDASNWKASSSSAKPIPTESGRPL